MAPHPIGYLITMAHVCRSFDAAPHDVFSVIADPGTYPDWLLGASTIRRIDGNFPSPGARFHHAVGIRPFVLLDHSEVLDVEPDRSLTMHVKGRPLITARVTFRIVGDADDPERSVLSVEEEPMIRSIGNVVRPALDPMTHFRNHRSLRRMEPLVMERKWQRIHGASSAKTTP